MFISLVSSDLIPHKITGGMSRRIGLRSVTYLEGAAEMVCCTLNLPVKLVRSHLRVPGCVRLFRQSLASNVQDRCNRHFVLQCRITNLCRSYHFYCSFSSS